MLDRCKSSWLNFLRREARMARLSVTSSGDIKRISSSDQGSKIAIVIALIVAALASCQVSSVAARYLHPSNFDRDFQDVENSMPILRREDFDDANGAAGLDDEGDEADEGADHNAAASYRNQDDGGNQDGAQGNDGYDDTEADGPYEETPVEREGQADLERFFDDHLGASDRDGMDKENLPTNLIASLSEPPHLQRKVPKVLQAAPLAPIQNPSVEPVEQLPTIQTTSFIRLPDERKLIVTNQITRNTLGSPIVYGDQSNDVARGNSYQATDSRQLNDDNQQSPKPARMTTAQNDPSNVSLDVEMEYPTGITAAKQQQQQHQRQRPSKSLSAADNQTGQQDARDDKMKAIGSEIIATENDDEDRVYVTNATNKPFKIDALDGFDPEADFQDAAKDLDNFNEVPRASSRSAKAHQKGARRKETPALESRGRDEEEDYEGSSNLANHRRQKLESTPLEFSFHDAPDSDMYEDASETDEVTFGHDDPYQTDLEAEMRNQDYQKVGKFLVGGPADLYRPEPNERTESRPDINGGESRESAEFNKNDDDKLNQNDDDDDDAEVDNDYKTHGPQARHDSSSTAPIGRKRDDPDEDNWINDGVDEMEIPSQSHQNFILDKAAKQDALARRAAEEELEVNKRQPPENVQTSDDGEESQRMPNADYLKNDLIEDDSG